MEGFFLPINFEEEPDTFTILWHGDPFPYDMLSEGSNWTPHFTSHLRIAQEVTRMQDSNAPSHESQIHVTVLGQEGDEKVVTINPHEHCATAPQCWAACPLRSSRPES